MKPFQFLEPRSIDEGMQAAADPDAMWLAGGTTLVDLMKLNVLTPSKLVSIKPLLDTKIEERNASLFIGAGCTMAQVAQHKAVARLAPAVRHSLLLAASPQIRNMATIGGNLLQRTRSPYFRHIDFPQDDQQRADKSVETTDQSSLAIMGHHGRQLGTYPGDFGVALVALDGTLHLRSGQIERTVAAREFFVAPKDGVSYSSMLTAGELIAGISITATSATRHSLYLKVRDRSSYAFALASAAVGLELDGQGPQAKILHAQVGLGGLATIPWYSSEAEKALLGQPATDETFAAAAEAALAEARPTKELEYKVTLAKRVLVRALQTLRDSGPPSDRDLWASQHGRVA